jgi:2-keto-4-pentenoate hydratase/2-oxohepta-3-ene-1,7-dioic acid hydratase in catechol pathway
MDLADAVGHPVFPNTLEALVARSGGTMVEVAEDAASREDYAEEFGVRRAHLLAPFVPPSRTPVIGPVDRPPWPRFQAYMDHSPEIGCIVGRAGRDLSPRQARSVIFGYVLVVRWLPATGRRTTVAQSLGPWVATPSEIDLRRAELRSSVGGRRCTVAALDPARWIFPDLLSERSRAPGGLRPGTLVTSTLGRSTRGIGIPLEPGTTVEVEANGLGSIRTELGDGTAADAVAGIS